MRRILPFLFLLLVGCALQPITDPRRPNPETEPTIVPTAVTIQKPTYTVERGSVTSQLFKSGRIAPVEQNQLSFAIDGQIATLQADKGDIVAAGDVVAVLDTTGLEQALQTAVSDLTLAQEQITLAQENQATNLRRAEIEVELVQLRLDFAVEQAGEEPTAEQQLAIEVLTRELELAQLSLDELDSAVNPTLTNQVVQAQRQVAQIETQIAQSTLVAPTAGTVMVVNFKEGDRLAAGQTVFVVADLNHVEIHV
ncbi:MAG: biotin/lipoyl-binding protein [Chloroflexota bacterium]